jgi:AcrR family transcriptional regulator
MVKVKQSEAKAADRVERLDAEAWIRVAREALIAGGVSGVRVERLAAVLGVTIGSFYWHFKSRRVLLGGLLQDWEAMNSAAWFAAVRSHPGEPVLQFEALNTVWVDEAGYDPAWDSAIRDWARSDAVAEVAVRRVDDQRIELLHGIFEGLGYKEPEALVRARITYFHQVGYYALRIVENHESRLALKSTYIRILKGDAPFDSRRTQGWPK